MKWKDGESKKKRSTFSSSFLPELSDIPNYSIKTENLFLTSFILSSTVSRLETKEQEVHITHSSLKTHSQLHIYNFTFSGGVRSAILAGRYSPVTDISRAGRTCLAYMLPTYGVLEPPPTTPSPFQSEFQRELCLILQHITPRAARSFPRLKSYTGCRVFASNRGWSIWGVNWLQGMSYPRRG